MLRIAKSTPGVLDLSAVKDEHGIPVTLNGPSHRDVPDHEEHNPVLQRIVELGWVVISKVPIVAFYEPALDSSPDLASTSDSSAPGLAIPDASPLDSVVPAEPGPAAAAEPLSASGDSDAQNNNHTTTSVADVAEPLSASGDSDAQNNNHTTTSVADVAPSPAIKPDRKSSRRP